MNFHPYGSNFAELRGLVLDSKTLEPVTGVRVNINREVTFTDTKGEFYLDSIRAGENLIHLSHEKIENKNEVIKLYPGFNTRRFTLKKKFVQNNNYDKVSKLEEKNIEKCKKDDKKKNSDSFISYWDPPPFQNFIKEIKNEKEDNIKKADFNNIRNLIRKLERESMFKGKIISDKDNKPLADVPVSVDGKILWTDKNGNFEYKTGDNNIELIVDFEGIEKINKNIKLDRGEKYLEIICKTLGDI
ncbi:MAG: hypothetical protein ACQESP_08860 [Candidatus Muiribacteriota bacterium]